jgi:hypothetical protein
LASCPSPNLPTNSSDESFLKVMVRDLQNSAQNGAGRFS